MFRRTLPRCRSSWPPPSSLWEAAGSTDLPRTRRRLAYSVELDPLAGVVVLEDIIDRQQLERAVARDCQAGILVYSKRDVVVRRVELELVGQTHPPQPLVERLDARRQADGAGHIPKQARILKATLPHPIADVVRHFNEGVLRR